MPSSELVKITELFSMPGKLQSIAPHGNGHINKTYISSWEIEGGVQRFIHQCINNLVFPDVENLMNNIQTVLNHIQSKQIDPAVYEDVTIVPAKNGRLFALDENKQYWRTYRYLENTKYIEVCENLFQASEAGRIIGFFQATLADLDVKKLNENIRKFTSAPMRVAQLEEAISKSPERLKQVQLQADFARSNAELTNLIERKIRSNEIPVRVVHGDTKINNVLFSSATEKAVCLVDLDTCMPGYSLYDFGDLVRSISFNVAEDEQDFSKIKFNPEFFTAITEGYAQNAKTFLNSLEISVLHLVPQLIALTLGIRFLTDFLNSDVYFKVRHPLHNLERTRTQFKIFEEFKNNESLMSQIVKDIF